MLQTIYKEKSVKEITQDMKLLGKRIRLFSNLMPSSKKHKYIQKAINRLKNIED